MTTITRSQIIDAATELAQNAGLTREAFVAQATDGTLTDAELRDFWILYKSVLLAE